MESTFGSTIDNPFFKIKEEVLDRTLPFDERTRWFRYLQYIPHIDNIKHCSECLFDILKNEDYPLEERYFFFSNDEEYIKLKTEFVNKAHLWFFFDYLLCPNNPGLTEYKITSAKYIISQFPRESYDSNRIYTFLIDICKDKNNNVQRRAECADMIEKYLGENIVSKETISELGHGREKHEDTKVSYTEKLRIKIFNHYDQCIKLFPKHLLAELKYEVFLRKKPLCEEIMFSYSPRDELYSEFVSTGLLSKDKFEKAFANSEKDYFGYRKKNLS